VGQRSGVEEKKGMLRGEWGKKSKGLPEMGGRSRKSPKVSLMNERE